jgi:hypothetical protein
MMGSLGGKIGCGVGLMTAAFFAVPVLHITPGACFFEGGCGTHEPIGLVLAAFMLLTLAALSGFIARLLINYGLNRRDD